jgi:hypothetical protein
MAKNKKTPPPLPKKPAPEYGYTVVIESCGQTRPIGATLDVKQARRWQKRYKELEPQLIKWTLGHDYEQAEEAWEATRPSGPETL